MEGTQAVAKKGLLKRIIEEKGSLLLKAAASAFVGAVFANARLVEGFSPFGVSAVAAFDGFYSLFALIGAAVGYAVLGLGENTVRLIAEALIICAVKWAFAAFFETEQKWALPVCTAAVNLAVGSVLFFTRESTVYDILLLISESVLCAGATYFLVKTISILKSSEGIKTAENVVAVSISLSLALLSLSKINIGGLSLGSVIANYVIIAMAFSFGCFGGVCSAVAIGTTLSLASGDGGFCAMALSFSGMLSGLFSKMSRYALCLIYLLCIVLSVAVASAKVEDLYFLYESVCAAALFLLTPERFFRNLKFIFPGTSGEIYPNKYLSARLDFVSSALEETSQTLCEMSDRLERREKNDIDSVFSLAADKVCRRCSMMLSCWESNYSDTMDGFNHLIPALKRQGRIEPENVPDLFRQRCARMPRLISEINTAYHKSLCDKQALIRCRQIKEVVTGQFSGISKLLCEMSQELSLTVCDTEKEKQIGRELLREGIEARDVCCPVDKFGHKTVEFYCPVSDADKIVESGIEENFSDICGATMCKPRVLKTGEIAKLSFSQETPFRIKMASFQQNAKNEKVCGDSFALAELPNGFSAVILSDGMGQGPSAALDSKMTVALLSRFLSLGFTTENSVSLVSSALMLKSEEETLATLDAAIFDLYNGSVSIKKAGAAPSFLKRSKKVSKIEMGSLPLGILGDAKVRSASLRLSKGDILVMGSDGLCSLSDNEIERIIKRSEGNIDALAKELGRAAGEKEGKAAEDDITVIVTKML